MNTIPQATTFKITIFLIFVSIIVGGGSWQSHRTATFQPCRFFTSTGDSLYFGRVEKIMSWADRYLIVNDAFGQDLYLLDTIDKIGERIGEEGSGPGEYRAASGFGVNRDTLFVVHGDDYQVSLFRLPDLHFIRKLYINSYFPGWQVWETGGTFLATDLPWKRGYRLTERRSNTSGDGLFGRFSQNGVLLQEFGANEFDSMTEYGAVSGLQRDMNGGFLAILPSGNVAFVYSRRPIFLEYTPSGTLVARRELEMPWRENLDDAPFKSNLGTWHGRPFVLKMEVTGSGILISARDWRPGGETQQGYLAIYDWEGSLIQYIHIPEYSDTEESGGTLYGGTEICGEFWVAIDADPNIRKLVFP